MSRRTKVQNNRSGWSSRQLAEATYMFDVVEQQRLYEERLRAEKAARRAAAKASAVPAVTKQAEAEVVAPIGYLRVWRHVADNEVLSFTSRIMALALQQGQSQRVAWPTMSVFDNKQPRMCHVIDQDYFKHGKRRLKQDLIAAVPSVAQPITVAVKGLDLYGSRNRPFLALKVESDELTEEAAAIKEYLPIVKTFHHKEPHSPHVSIIRPVTFEIAQAMTHLAVELPNEISFNAARLMAEPQAPIAPPVS